MAYTLTTALLTRLRRKIGDESETAWDDAELNDSYDEAGGSWNLTIALLFEELRNNAVKFADYKQNESEEKRSQIFANLEKTARYYRSIVDDNATQVQIVALKQRPPHNKTKPRGSSW